MHFCEQCTLDTTTTSIKKYRYLNLQPTVCTPLSEATGTLPQAELGKFEQFFALSSTDPSFAHALLQRGVDRLASGEEIEATVERGFQDQPHIICINAKVPQSQDRGTYDVRVALRCSASLPYVVENVEEARCHCVIRTTSRCCHVAALLCLLVAIVAQGDVAVCTSLPCTWIGRPCASEPGAAKKEPLLTAADCRVVKVKLSELCKPGLSQRIEADHEAIEAAKRKRENRLDEWKSKLNFDFFTEDYRRRVYALAAPPPRS